jgi:predicted HTH domain antitoxin
MADVSRMTAVERFILLLLYSPVGTKKNVSITGDIWLQKEVYAVSQQAKQVEQEAGYRAFRFGSFSEFVELTKEQYQSSGYIQQSENNEISLTTRGKVLAEQVWKFSSESDRKLAQEVKDQFNDMGYWELLLFMYDTYPLTATDSQVRDDVYKRRLPSAISLYKKGKVSLEKAAELAGMHIEAFHFEITKQNEKEKRISTLA